MADSIFNEEYLTCFNECLGPLEKLIGNKQNAEDTLAKAMAKIWIDHSSGKITIKNLRSFAYTVARNLWLDEQRKNNKLVFAGDHESLDELINERANRYYRDHVNPMIIKEEQIRQDKEAHYRHTLITRALNRISEKCKSLLTRTIVLDEKLSKIFNELDYTSVASAKTSKSRCKKALATAFLNLQQEATD